MRKTKIICTLGPAIDSDEMLTKMIENGLDCARLNFSHGNYDEHFKRIERVKKLRKKLNKHIPILLDTKGPEIRLKKFENDAVCIEDGQEFILYAEECLGNKQGASVTYPYCAEKLKVGNRILIDDGKVEIEVIKIDGKNVVCKVNNGGKISNNKSINLPDCPIDMPYISDRDKNDIIFGAKHGVDYIAASFVRCKDDVLQVRKLLNENDGGEVKIIAKIENAQGVDNIDEIVDVSDGIMIARGDMGVELPFTALPKIQKDIIKKCFRQGKIVITATQMLESMTKCPRPTRAEVSDIANAIYDGTTAIMLSGESAAGDYPVESVSTMAHIAESTEAVIKYYSRFEKSALLLGNDQLNAICKAACEASYCLNAKAIVTLSRNGRTPKLISNYRPNCPILGAVLNEKACRQLNLAWNVKPVLAEEMFSTDDLLKEGIELAIKEKMATIGDTIILTCSAAIGDFITDLMKIHIITEEDVARA